MGLSREILGETKIFPLFLLLNFSHAKTTHALKIKAFLVIFPN
jgi:hypothetical protein